MTSSPFTRAVVSSMRALYPESLADTSFDNTGLLLEAPFLPAHRNRNSVLLTIDLTRAVAEEAIQNKHSVVVAYHPIIFRGLKSLTLNDSQQQSLLRLAAHGISVYSPHTAVDIVPGGMADWLCDIVTGKLDAPEPEAFTMEDGRASPLSAVDVTTSESASDSDVNGHAVNPSPKPTTSEKDTSDPFTTPQPKTTRPKRPLPAHRTYSRPTYPRPRPKFHPSSLPHDRKVITPSPTASIDAANTLTSSTRYSASNTGAGRLITFSTPQPLPLLITRIAHAIGLPKGFPVAIPQNSSVEDISIRTVGVCPGSGSSVISHCDPAPDLVFTGELSHHETLAVTERGGCVLCLFHSNSERGYLHATMQEQLTEKLKSVWEDTRKKVKEEAGGEKGWQDGVEEILEDESSEVSLSTVDRDPFGIVVLVESEMEGVDIRS